ncbi:uncharacterized protein [Littorina saxatilis]|uniref:uncharacterized protein n=1 Tax=Littorina saxatilis TaxID=31220 RepID=UPI0038B42461
MEAERLRMARTILRVKDSHRIPYKALQALRSKAGIDSVPPENVLQRESLRLATCLELVAIDKILIKDGFRRQLSDIVEFMLDMPENRHLLQTTASSTTITLRFACDGAKITKHKDSVRAVCKLLRSQEVCAAHKESSDDEISLIVYMGKEDRATFESGIKTTLQQMKQASNVGFQIQQKTVMVKWTFCSDWKAMAMVRGINQANSDYFCLWCHCTKADISNLDIEEWKVERNEKEQNASLEGRSPPRGYKHTDLLHWVPYQDMIPDELHLRMRISNKLVNQVVVWSITQDRKQPLLDEMKRVRVDFRFVEEQGDDGKGKIKKWTQLGGDDLRKVIKNLNIITILEEGPRDMAQLQKLPMDYLRKTLQRKTGEKHPKASKDFLIQEIQNATSAEEQREMIANRPQHKRMLVDGAEQPLPQQNHVEERVLKPEKVQEIWDEFDRLMELIRTAPGSDRSISPADFQKAAKAWAVKFKKHTFKEDVIPYIHVLVYHIPQAMRNHGFLPHIGISQVERKNYDQHLTYFQGSSRQGGKHRKEVTKQVLEREN